MNELLDKKNETVVKIKQSMNKMSKKMMHKIMDYVNLKFKIALTKNKVNIKQDKFVGESDILEIYDRLKYNPKHSKKHSKINPDLFDNKNDKK